jgi:hypothetical protein
MTIITHVGNFFFIISLLPMRQCVDKGAGDIFGDSILGQANVSADIFELKICD